VAIDGEADGRSVQESLTGRGPGTMMVTLRVCLPKKADTPELLFHVSIEAKLQGVESCKVRAEQERSKRSTATIAAEHCTCVYK
jgi:hypothetical protein